MKLALIVGASGTGKDTLLRKAASHFQHNDHIVFMQRFITRAPDDNEHNYYVDAMAFSILKEHDFFTSTWQAHNNIYGIARHHLEQLPEDGLAIASISRTVISDFEKKFQNVFTIQVQVHPDRLRDRLVLRKREDNAAIKKRLQRADLPVQANNLILFDNSAPLSSTAPLFIDLLSSLCAR